MNKTEQGKLKPKKNSDRLGTIHATPSYKLHKKGLMAQRIQKKKRKTIKNKK